MGMTQSLNLCVATGLEQSITVDATGTLSDKEISEIIEENELYEVKLKD